MLPPGMRREMANLLASAIFLSLCSLDLQEDRKSYSGRADNSNPKPCKNADIRNARGNSERSMLDLRGLRAGVAKMPN